MYQAILLFQNDKIDHSTKVTYHGVLHFFTLLCGSAGFVAVFFGKIANGFDHFTTAHGVWGPYTLLATYLLFLGGIFTKYSYYFRWLIKPATIKRVHRIAGFLVFFMAINVMVLAFLGPWGTFKYSLLSRIGLASAIGVSGGFVLYKPAGYLWKSVFIRTKKDQ